MLLLLFSGPAASQPPFQTMVAISIPLEFVVEISVDGGTGGRWDEGMRGPRLLRAIAATPINRMLAAPALKRTDAEG